MKDKILEDYSSKNKYEEYFNHAPDGILVIDGRGNILDFNYKIITATGYNSGELSSMNIKEILYETDLKKLEIDLEKTILNGSVTGDYKITTKKNKIIDLRVNTKYLDEDAILIYARNITSDKQILSAVQKQWAYFQQLFDGSPEAITLLDKEGRIILINTSFKTLFGYEDAEIEGRYLDDIIVPRGLKEKAKSLTNSVTQGASFQGESQRQTASGKLIEVAIKAIPITQDNEVIGAYAIYQDITAQKKEQEKIKYLSFHDEMTGLYNRRYFENELERLDKSRELPISIIVADLDDLKSINDNFGHPEGDQYIKNAANLIGEVTREEDVVARIGGDEFAIILVNTSNKQAAKFKDRFRLCCQEFNEDNDFPVSLSIGWASKETKSMSLYDVYKEADSNMYKNKNYGKNIKTTGG